MVSNGYYSSNAIYRKTDENKHHGLKYPGSDTWILVYGNSDSCPKLLLVASAFSSAFGNGATKGPTEKERSAVGLAKKISVQCDTDIPLLFMRFDKDAKEISSVDIMEVPVRENSPASQNKGKLSRVSFEELVRIFQSKGLSVQENAGRTRKYLNKQNSSAYHEWQRENLGKDIKVTDMDLFRLDNDGRISDVYELKRSYIPLERWEPYKADYKNFILLAKLLSMSDIEFSIVYNLKLKDSNIEDTSKLKIFPVTYDAANNDIMVGQSVMLFEQEFFAVERPVLRQVNDGI